MNDEGFEIIKKKRSMQHTELGDEMEDWIRCH